MGITIGVDPDHEILSELPTKEILPELLKFLSPDPNDKEKVDYGDYRHDG
jgi:hypothetical protein